MNTELESKLIELTKIALESVEEARKYAKEHQLIDTQLYINFEDELNKFSVMDPNI